MQSLATPCSQRATGRARLIPGHRVSKGKVEKWRGIILALVLLTAVISNARAAEITISRDEPYISINIEGKLEKGDYQKMIRGIKKHGKIPGHISISSPGGDVVEAMNIGRFARKALLEFWVSKKCNSACLLIYFGTIRGIVDPFRVFGIHRPYFDSSYFSGLSASEAREKYKAMENQVREYLREMDVPQFFIDRMFAIPSNSVQTITHEQLVDIVGRTPPAYEEWIIAKCGSLSNKELQDLYKIAVNPRHEYSIGYINYLENKRDSIRKCEKQAQDEVRRKLYRSL